jgi:hypothetical protein
MNLYEECLEIIDVIKSYLYEYDKKNKMPFIKNIINQSINQKKSNNETLLEKYDYYSKIYDIDEKIISKKQNQVHNIIKIIKEIDLDNNHQIENVHEICCGNSVLGNEITKNKKVTLFGYDINELLLEKNKQMMKGIFIKKDLLKETIQFKNDSTELITCLHGCGQLHRNLIDNIIQQKYNGKIIIIPCCYYKYNNNDYKLMNFDITIPFTLLKSASLNGIIEQNDNYKKISLQKIKLNLLYDFLLKDKNISELMNEYNKYILEEYQNIKYISVPNKYTYYKDDTIFWKNIFSNKEFIIGKYSYENCKQIIESFDILANTIYQHIFNEKIDILNPLTRLIEILIILDYAITIKNNTQLNIIVKPFISSKNSPKNIAIIGY